MRRIYMKIIALTQTQYKNFSTLHPQRNFGQTVEYTYLEENRPLEKLFLGLIDEANNVWAATLLLVKKETPTIRIAFAPDGFLIDYTNFTLLKEFTEELIKYLKRERITYLITNPMFKYRTFNKKNALIDSLQPIYNHFIRLNYQEIGYDSDFSKYDVILETVGLNPTDIYKKFNRNTKRLIKESLNFGITLHKGSSKDIPLFYEIIKKKTQKSQSYYQNMMNAYNTNENKMEIFFTKLNPQTFLNNMKKLYEKERKRNETIYKTINKRNGKMTEKMLNKKINSDSTLEKYKNLLNKAILLSQKGQVEITIGTSAVIKNNREIYFLIDGYREAFRSIHSSYLLKWAIIKKYAKDGYHTFNLGEIHKNYMTKYHGQYIYKIGFGGNVIEYPQNFLLVVNQRQFIAYTKMKKWKEKLKRYELPHHTK